MRVVSAHVGGDMPTSRMPDGANKLRNAGGEVALNRINATYKPFPAIPSERHNATPGPLQQRDASGQCLWVAPSAPPLLPESLS